MTLCVKKGKLSHYRLAYGHYRSASESLELPSDVLQRFIQHQEKSIERCVRWSEITFVHLHLKTTFEDAKPSDYLLIDIGLEIPVGMIPKEIPQMGYYMFVYIADQNVIILGLMRRVAFKELLDQNGYAVLGDINTFEWQIPDVYSFSLTTGYYQEPTEFNGSLDDKYLAVDVFLGRMAKIRPEELDVPGGLENMRVGFFYIEIMVSIDLKMTKLLEDVELQLLNKRLELLKNPMDRAQFVRGWFPDLVQCITPYETRHAISGQMKRDSNYGKVFEFYKSHYTVPDPCILFNGDAEYLSEFVASKCPVCCQYDCPRLPSMGGRITFSHEELPRFLINRFKKLFQMGVTWSHTLIGTAFAEKFWFSENEDISAIKHGLVGSNKQTSDPVREIHMLSLNAKRKLRTLSKTDRWLVSELAPKYFTAIKESWDEIEAPPAPGSPTKLTVRSAPVVPITEVPTLPSDYGKLIEFAERYWPPCLVAVVRKSTGPFHFKHPERRKISPMLKAFGFSLEDAQHIFFLLFSTTAVERTSTKAQFLDGHRGSIIATDYANPKVNEKMQSCRTMIQGNYCPFASSVDIEDTARTLCTKHMNTLRMADGKQTRDRYLIASPRSYVLQRVAPDTK